MTAATTINNHINFLKNQVFTKQHAVIAAKVFFVASVIAGLAAATFFTCGVAIALAAPFTLKAGLGSFLASGALWGAATGLGTSVLTTPFMASNFNMYRYNEGQNLKDAKEFLLASLFVSTVSAGMLAVLNSLGRLAVVVIPL